MHAPAPCACARVRMPVFMLGQTCARLSFSSLRATGYLCSRIPEEVSSTYEQSCFILKTPFQGPGVDRLCVGVSPAPSGLFPPARGSSLALLPFLPLLLPPTVSQHIHEIVRIGHWIIDYTKQSNKLTIVARLVRYIHSIRHTMKAMHDSCTSS